MKLRVRYIRTIFAIALLAILAFNLASLFYVLADPQSTVYVVVLVDAEMWGGLGHAAYLGTSNPNPTLQVNEYAVNPPSTLASVINPVFRLNNKDSFGNPFKITWFAEMDYLFAQGNYVWGDGSSAGVSGYTSVYDLLMNNWGDGIRQWGDSIEYHHHFMVYDGVWQHYDNGPDEGYPGYQEEALDRMIIDRAFYPSTFRSGWLDHSDSLSSWLDSWMPFDFGHDDGNWYPIQSSSDGRWVASSAWAPSQSDVDAAFSRAQATGSAIYSTFCHSRENVPGLVSTLQGYLNTADANPNFADVSFKYVTAREAMQQTLGFNDVTPPSFTITPNSESYTVTSSEPLWQNHPYVAFKYATGEYARAEATSIGTNMWTVSPLRQKTFSGQNLAVNARADSGLAINSATASSYRPNYPPQRAIDGIDNTNSFWDSTPGILPQWLQLDLGSVQTFANIRTHFWDGDNRNYRYYIDVSNDSSSWIRAVNEKVGKGVTWDYFSPTMTARYIRITVQSNSANSYGHIIEVNVNVQSASVTASSSIANHTPELAINGIESTSDYWGTNTTVQLPQWLKIDLRSPVSFNKIRTHFYDVDDRTYTYRIEASQDDQSWTTIVPLKIGKGLVTDTFPQITSRYVRVTITSNTANTGAQLEEVKIYNEVTTSLSQPEKIGVAGSDLYGNPAVLVADAFTQNAYSLTVSAVGSGSVSLNNTGPYHLGDVVKLTAVPVAGWSFSGWSGALTGSVNPAELTITGDLSVTATFVINTYTITVTQGAHGLITPGTITVDYGADQGFTIIPDPGYHIFDVAVDGVSQGAVLTYTFNHVEADHTITASFAHDVYTPFSIISNSTITELAFNSTSQILSFTASGPSGSTGFANVTISKTLMSDISALQVYLDDSEIGYSSDDLDDSWLIYFTYSHSTHKIVMDFSSHQGSSHPSFGGISANTTVAGSSVQLSCPVNSGTGVSSYIYSWNNTGTWVNQTLTRFSSFINGTAAYATFSGVWNTVAGNTISVIIYANDTSNNWAASSQYDFIITAGAATKLVIIAGGSQTLQRNQLSSAITVQRQDKYGNPVTSGSTIVSLTSTSRTAVFFSNNGVTKTSSVTIADGSSTVSFWFKDTALGTQTLRVSSSGLTSATTKFKITR